MVYDESLQKRLIGASLLFIHNKYVHVCDAYALYIAGSRDFKNVVVIVCGGSAVSLDLLNKWRKDFDV